MEKKLIIISFGRRSIIDRIFASFFFAVGLYVLVLFFINIPIVFTKYYVDSLNRIFAMELTLIGFALPHAISIAHHFNLQEMKYRKYYYIGPIGYGKWYNLKKLNRVSTFLNSGKDCEVNIWDIKNNRYKIAAFSNIDAAVIYGRELAKTLKIKFKERN